MIDNKNSWFSYLGIGNSIDKKKKKKDWVNLNKHSTSIFYLKVYFTLNYTLSLKQTVS